MSDYEMLREEVNIKCPSESFDRVNQYIENKIPSKDENEKIRKIKSLICYIEGKLNTTSFFSNAAISYALIVGFASILCSLKGATDDQRVGAALILLVVAIGLIIAGKIYLKKDSIDTFILKALYFKLDELKNKNESSAETSTTKKSDTTNGINTANDPDEKKT